MTETMSRPDSLVRPLLSEAIPVSDRHRLLAGYAAAAAPFDEMMAADGSIRPHWQRFVDGFTALGPEGRTAAGDSTTGMCGTRRCRAVTTSCSAAAPSEVTRPIARGITGNGETGVSLAVGLDVAVAFHQQLEDAMTTEQPLLTFDAIQPAAGGGASDGWLAVWPRP